MSKPGDHKKELDLIQVSEEQKNCMHMSFRMNGDIHRITKTEDPTEKPEAFVAEIQISCQECGLPFSFKGLPFMIGPATKFNPSCNPDGTEARLPIMPVTDIYVVLKQDTN